MKDKLSVKAFSEEDIDLLYEWANDSESRQNSFCSEPISYDTHVAWCQDKLESEEVNIFIVYLGMIPVGQLRMRYDSTKAYISYSIDNKFRGIGLGKKVIELIEIEQLYKGKQIKELIGEVKCDNIASQKVFEHCMYEKKEKENHLEYVKYVK
ncbi:GNAT family N-acetyltransferase [Anaerosporobacter sp.]|uniref:GNAT family N-acetyltransferase n=1 Tax=Anaerosporobacter sp. TaxID=1872529 RepID=UPI00286F37C9|nr:GNAT family N-acetyltransferase [Anaerosporobacter sp.]